MLVRILVLVEDLVEGELGLVEGVLAVGSVILETLLLGTECLPIESKSAQQSTSCCIFIKYSFREC